VFRGLIDQPREDVFLPLKSRGAKKNEGIISNYVLKATGALSSIRRFPGEKTLLIVPERLFKIEFSLIESKVPIRTKGLPKRLDHKAENKNVRGPGEPRGRVVGRDRKKQKGGEGKRD